jgi:FkbM family methyltransferase
MQTDWTYGFSTHELREAFIIKYYGHGPAEHDYFKHYSPNGEFIYVEAGANVGRTGFLAQAMGGKAILIEPSPLNTIAIEKEIKAKDLKNVTLIKNALGKEKKVGFIVMVDGKSDRIVPDDTRMDRISPVQIDTLPNILADLKITKVDLFACDIEGTEVDVVKTLDPAVELNVAMASYHLGSQEAVEKDIIKVLETKVYKNISYESGVVYASTS